MGKGLYSMEAPASSILDQFLVKLTAKGSDVRTFELSMQPTKLEPPPWRNHLHLGLQPPHAQAVDPLDVLGVAPLDRLGELSGSARSV